LLFGCRAVKRADEIIFNAQSSEASRVKSADDAAADEQTPHAVSDDVSDDVSGGNDEKKRASEVKNDASSSSSSAVAADDVQTETLHADDSQQQGIRQSLSHALV